ncbi:hypothetical protein H6F89_34410 [Cyanobacteria bacterium FACHB-63]|nr:hypothetical protein [Cyanobacteria bacterium FACHB-63]
MAKRVLGDDYNPVGSRLQRVLLPIKAVKPTQSPAEESMNAELDTAPPTSPINFFEKQGELRDAIDRSETGALKGARSEAMLCEMRCRCTKSERRKWHDFAYRLTGEPNTLSHILRALLVLLEHAEGDFEKMSALVQALEKPSKNDSLQVALYEQKLAQILWETMRRSGRLDRKGA